jgi:hypothetical protein
MADPDSKRRLLRMDVAQRIGVVLLAILLAIPILHLIAQALFSAKQAGVREDLDRTTTQAEFIRAAESHGLACRIGVPGPTNVWCDWWGPPSYDIISWIEFVAEGIVGMGDFADGK